MSVAKSYRSTQAGTVKDQKKQSILIGTYFLPQAQACPRCLCLLETITTLPYYCSVQCNYEEINTFCFFGHNSRNSTEAAYRSTRVETVPDQHEQSIAIEPTKPTVATRRSHHASQMKLLRHHHCPPQKRGFAEDMLATRLQKVTSDSSKHRSREPHIPPVTSTLQHRSLPTEFEFEVMPLFGALAWSDVDVYVRCQRLLEKLLAMTVLVFVTEISPSFCWWHGLRKVRVATQHHASTFLALAQETCSALR